MKYTRKYNKILGRLYKTLYWEYDDDAEGYAELRKLLDNIFLYSGLVCKGGKVLGSACRENFSVLSVEVIPNCSRDNIEFFSGIDYDLSSDVLPMDGYNYDIKCYHDLDGNYIVGHVFDTIIINNEKITVEYLMDETDNTATFIRVSFARI